MQFLRDSYLKAAQPLIDTLADFDLHLLLPKGIPTFRTNAGNLTRPDNVFGTSALASSLVACNAHPEFQPPLTDHFPVITELDLSATRVDPRVGYDWCTVDWDEFRNQLKAALPSHQPSTITTRVQFDKQLHDIELAIAQARDSCVDSTNISIFSRRWWTEELKQMRKEVTKLGRKALPFKGIPNHPAVCEYHRARNKYGEKIKQAKKDCWEAYLENADSTSIWHIGRMAKAPPLMEEERGSRH